MTVKANRSLGGHPTAERAAEIGNAVVGATMQAFAEHGADFSMDQVASLAGVSKQAIYRRWKSKVDLIIDTIDRVLADGLVRPRGAGADSIAQMRDAAWQLFDTDIATSYRVNIFLQAESFRGERIQQRLLGWRGEFLTVYTHYLHAIERDGLRVDGDIAVQAEILMELLLGASSVLAMTGAVSDDDKRRAFEDRWQAFRRMAIKHA